MRISVNHLSGSYQMSLPRIHKLSVALITKNEESTIARCLESLKWADEIVILDGFSTDRTVEICKGYTDKVYQKAFESFPAERDFVLKKTSHSWVLSVDADMYFPPALCQEIQEVLTQEKIAVDGYYMKGLTVFLGKEIRHCGWFDCRYLRLFNKEKGSYDTKTFMVLDLFDVPGPKGRLRHHLMHYAKETFIEYYGKIKRTSYLTALEYKNKGLKINATNAFYWLLIKPMIIFIYKYVYKRGFLDGVVGLIVSINSAISYYVAYAALWEIQQDEMKAQRGR